MQGPVHLKHLVHHCRLLEDGGEDFGRGEEVAGASEHRHEQEEDGAEAGEVGPVGQRRLLVQGSAVPP